MGKADEERLAIGVQKCPCLYDKVVSSFHNKNQNKNAWKAVAKDIGLETSEAAKNAFTSLKDLNSGTDAEKVMKAFWCHYNIFIWFNSLILIASLKTQF